MKHVSLPPGLIPNSTNSNISQSVYHQENAFKKPIKRIGSFEANTNTMNEPNTMAENTNLFNMGFNVEDYNADPNINSSATDIYQVLELVASALDHNGHVNCSKLTAVQRAALVDVLHQRQRQLVNQLALLNGCLTCLCQTPNGNANRPNLLNIMQLISVFPKKQEVSGAPKANKYNMQQKTNGPQKHVTPPPPPTPPPYFMPNYQADTSDINARSGNFPSNATNNTASRSTAGSDAQSQASSRTFSRSGSGIQPVNTPHRAQPHAFNLRSNVRSRTSPTPGTAYLLQDITNMEPRKANPTNLDFPITCGTDNHQESLLARVAQQLSNDLNNGNEIYNTLSQNGKNDQSIFQALSRRVRFDPFSVSEGTADQWDLSGVHRSENETQGDNPQLSAIRPIFERSNRRTLTLPTVVSNAPIQATDVQHVLHMKGRCKPCAFFYNQRKGCRNGEHCEFCHHEEHSKLTLKQWKKQQQKQIRNSRMTQSDEFENDDTVFSSALDALGTHYGMLNMSQNLNSANVDNTPSINANMNGPLSNLSSLWDSLGGGIITKDLLQVLNKDDGLEESKNTISPLLLSHHAPEVVNPVSNTTIIEGTVSTDVSNTPCSIPSTFTPIMQDNMTHSCNMNTEAPEVYPTEPLIAVNEEAM